VLALVDGGVYVLHRIIRVEGEEIWLRGDGCLRRSVEHSSRERVAGRAVRFVRNGREIDCYSEGELRKLRLWNRLLPIRRYLLAVYRIVYRKRIYRKKGKEPCRSKLYDRYKSTPPGWELWGWPYPRGRPSGAFPAVNINPPLRGGVEWYKNI
jgi:hypothetical protein